MLCGGGADDCDDTNANVHPGATEICDFLDDNCNGIVDEGIWANGSIVTLNGSAGSGSSNAPTYAPSLGRLTDGSFVAVGYNVGQSGAGFWHVATDLKSADTGHNFGAQPNGVGASSFGFATDGVDALYTQTTGSTHSALHTFLGAGTQNGTVISTATADTAYADSNGMVAWVPTLTHYAFVYSDAHLVGTSNEPCSNLFATAVTSAGVRCQARRPRMGKRLELTGHHDDLRPVTNRRISVLRTCPGGQTFRRRGGTGRQRGGG